MKINYERNKEERTLTFDERDPEAVADALGLLVGTLIFVSSVTRSLTPFELKEQWKREVAEGRTEASLTEWTTSGNQ